jgi:hypothetical protein
MWILWWQNLLEALGLISADSSHRTVAIWKI